MALIGNIQIAQRMIRFPDFCIDNKWAKTPAQIPPISPPAANVPCAYQIGRAHV